MGVKGLESFFADYVNDRRVMLNSLRGKAILVDLPALEHHLLNERHDLEIQDDFDEYLVMSLMTFCTRFHNDLNIFFIFVDDVSF